MSRLYSFRQGLGLVLSAGLVFAATTPHAEASTTTTSIVAVGDIARKNGGQYLTGKLAKQFNPQLALLAGDLVYPRGEASDYTKYLYASDWVSLLPHSMSVPGNHEWMSGAQGYKKFIDKYTHSNTGSYYWWKKSVNGWLYIGLDSEKMSQPAQLTFFKNALANNTSHAPTIVMWHKPRYSYGEHGNFDGSSAFWTELAKDEDVKLVLWGHEHNYERRIYAQHLSNGHTHNFVTLVVGNGGAELRTCPKKIKNAATEKLICGTANNYGFATLIASPHKITWAFRQAYTQAGVAKTRVKDQGEVTW